MNKKFLATSAFTALIMMSPFAASALSISDLQSQLQTLLTRISSMQTDARVNANTTVSADSALTIAPPRICGILNRNLSRGAQGDDVRGLQEFLTAEGVLSASATGYFGPATANALARWQAQSGVQSVGSVGPLTRDLIKKRCGGVANQYGFRVTPQAGQAPLTVTAYANVGGFSIYRYFIDFGDGSTQESIWCNAPADACQAPGTVVHTYAQDGLYSVALVRVDSQTNASTVLAKEQVRVGSDIAPTTGQLSADPSSGNAPLPVSFTYRPGQEGGQYWIDFGDGGGQIMDVHQIYCIEAPCISPVIASHTYTTPGIYTAYVTSYIACMHTNPRCMIATIPLAKVVVTVGGSNSGNGTPVISGFSGPVSLAVNQVGTWNISASDPENGRLSYSIIWGDEWVRGTGNLSTAADASIVQQTSFTHAYSQPGNYTVQLSVTDESGKSAQASASVQVSQSVCTKEYMPVCGRPQGCANTCAPGMYCTMMCRLSDPVTYGNRCQMNNANANFIHEGACNGTEM